MWNTILMRACHKGNRQDQPTELWVLSGQRRSKSRPIGEHYFWLNGIHLSTEWLDRSPNSLSFRFGQMDANGLSQNHLKNHAKAFKIIQIHLTIIENPSNILQNPPKIRPKSSKKPSHIIQNSTVKSWKKRTTYSLHRVSCRGHVIRRWRNFEDLLHLQPGFQPQLGASKCLGNRI